MSKKTTKRLITLIISFLAIIFLQFAFSSPGAAAQTDVIKEPAPLLPSDNQDGTPGVQQLPADWAAHAVTGEAQPGGERAPSVGLAPEGWETIMTQGFEGAWPASGWSLYGVSEGVYERLWGDDNYRSYSGNWSAWPVAGGPDGGPASVHLTYPNDTESWMIYGPFDLSDASAAEVQFQLWREIELEYDWAFFGVSGEALGPFNGFYYDGFQDWTQYTYPLNDYVGDNSVYVAWEFYSDSSVYYGGPFVDDIVISKFIDPPVADFNGTPRSGTRPLAVNFSNQSTGSVSSYSWSFGDGGSSTQQNPSHTYTTAGSYTVSLTVSGPGGSDSNTKNNYISVADPAQPPTAEFSGTPTSGATPLAVSFTNLSTGDVSSYSWNFGDGGSSTQANPSHTYTTPGNYTVALTVSGPGGSNTNTKNNYISVTAPVPTPVAEFSGTPTSGNSPLAVNFTNLSTGNVTSYAWDFGDGGSSTLASPSHTYTTAGSYTVKLTVSGPGGSNTNTKNNYISVTAPPAPTANFSGTPTSGTRPLTVNFTNLSTGNITGFAWNFGDGATSTLQNPSHTYTTAGSYTVKLTVSGPGGSNAHTKTNYIQVTAPAPPVANFSASPRFGNKPLTVNFTNLSSGNVTAYAWYFSDGGSSTLANPSHTFTQAGAYLVELTVTGPGGSNTKTESRYIFVNDPSQPFDLIADNLEITQGVQDLNNSVPLVANKRTFVRFHVSANMVKNQATSARLRLQNDSGSDFYLNPLYSGRTIIVKPEPNRGVASESFLFELPSYFTNKGDLTLTAELNLSKSPAEKGYANNALDRTVTFETVPTPTLVLYSIGYGNDIYPKQIHRTKLVDWLKRAYPLSDVKVIYRTAYYGTKPSARPTCEQVNSLLWSKKLADIANKSVTAGAHYYGMVDDAGGFMRGCSDLPGQLAAGAPAASLPSVASGPAGVSAGKANDWNTFWDTDGSYADFYGGHELAHSYARYHAMYCGAGGGISYPNTNGRISPSLTGSTAIYGFDISTKVIYTPDWTDIMTYCDNEWLSDFTYEGLMSYFKAKPVLNASNVASAPMDRLSVVGTIDPATQEVDLTPLFIIHDVEDIKPAVPGDYAIVLRNAGGAELARYPFTPDEMESGPGPADEPEIELLRISELVPYVNGTTRVDIEKSGTEISSVTAGAAAPSVTVTSPNGGETLSGDPIHVTWTANDPDGDPLVFNVQYSKDGGQTWEMVAQFLNANEAYIDAANIAGSDQALFRVEASDGIHTAHDESNNAFTVPNRIPDVAIVEPVAGQTFVVDQTVGLVGSAYDVDTGTMDDKLLEWSSDKDGLLGSGQQLSLTGLSLGQHTITFRADDGQGGVAEESVQITVVSESTPVPDMLLVGPTAVIFEPNGGQTSTTLSIANQNAQSAIGWTATKNAPWVKLDANSGTTPDTVGVSFVDTGLDVGSYSANITFSSPNTPGQSFDVRVSLTVVPDSGNQVYLPVAIR